MNRRLTKVAFFTVLVAAFWFVFFRLLIGPVHTETFMFASASSVILSVRGKGWGLLERLLR